MNSAPARPAPHPFRAGLISTLKWISIAIFAVLVLVVLWQVFARQVIQQPSTWSTTVAQYLLVWLTLFSMAFVFGERGHVAVDSVTRLVPHPVARVLSGLVQISILTFALLGLVWGGIRGVGLTWDQAIPGLPVTVGHMYLALPIAGILVALIALLDLVDVIGGRDLHSLEPVPAAAAAIAEAPVPGADPILDGPRTTPATSEKKEG